MFDPQEPTFDEVISGPIGRCVAWYLLSSYLYYIWDNNVIEDSEYDRLCKRLLDEYDSITHPHKYLLDKDALSAGSGFHLKDEDYPQIAKDAALLLATKVRKRKRRTR